MKKKKIQLERLAEIDRGRQAIEIITGDRLELGEHKCKAELDGWMITSPNKGFYKTVIRIAKQEVSDNILALVTREIQRALIITKQ